MLTSERLLFRAWTAHDLDDLVALHTDPRVQSGYPFGPEVWTEAGIRTKLEKFLSEQECYGFTKWRLSLRDGTFAGRAGWSPWEGDELEIGYAVVPALQGRGLAQEAARSLVDWATERWEPRRLVGFALLSNTASRAVLEKAGLVFEGEQTINGAANAFYRLRSGRPWDGVIAKSLSELPLSV